MRNNPVELYRYAESAGIEVAWFPLWADCSMAIQLEDGSCAVALDPWKMATVPMETVSLAHELGHCDTGSFYNPYAACDIRKRHENRADKWAIQHLISEEDLDQAVADGCEDIPALAEHFGVTEDFMKKAVCWYTHGNLAADLYF